MAYNTGELHMERDPEREKLFHTEMATDTKACKRHPGQNQDRAFIDTNIDACGVFDGVSDGDGEQAAVLASKYINRGIAELTELERDRHEHWTPAQWEGYMGNLLKDAHRAIKTQFEGNHTTTAAFAKFVANENGEPCAVIASAGDARVFKRKADGSIQAITLDDQLSYTKAAELGLDPRQLQDRFDAISGKIQLSEDRGVNSDKMLFNYSNVLTQSLGSNKIEEITPQTYTVPLGKGESILIMSDGIVKNLSRQVMEQTISQNIETGLGQTNKALIEASYQAAEDGFKGGHDDMTVVTSRIK